jgi:predicted RNA binding protein YcfA (HicA-like mRNA interferase family)
VASKALGILAQAKSNPAGVRFRDLVRLVEAVGFVLDRQKGSHRVYRREGLTARINLQPQGSMAKVYQVRQVLSVIETHKLEVS